MPFVISTRAIRRRTRFLAETGEHQLYVGAVLRQAGERDVLSRMMKLVRVVLQVRHDVEHQLVIWPLSGLEHIDLLVQQVQKLIEISMLGVPCGDRIGHFSLLLEQGHCMQVNIGPPVCLGEINRHIASLRLSPPGKLSRSARGALLTQLKMR